MQDFHRQKQTDYRRAQQTRAIQIASKKLEATQTIKFSINLAKFVKLRSWFGLHESQARTLGGLMALIMIFSIAVQIQAPRMESSKYDISKYEGTLLKNPVNLYGEKLTLSQQSRVYEYNKDYNPTSDGVSGTVFTPKFTATFAVQDKKTVTVTDPVNKVDIALTPKFKLYDAKKDTNHIIYPLQSLDASMVYTTRMGSIKEDIILNKFQKDTLALSYDVKISSGTELRVEKDGSLAVYGVASSLLGNVTTSSTKDAELLQQARTNGKKTQLLFTIPAPFIMQANKKASSAKTWYTLESGRLTVHASNLKKASYPLSIDPSVYIQTAAKLMRGNNESNIGFDVANALIQKSHTSGARINAWTSTNNLSTPVWGQGTAVAGGYVYSVAGGQSNAITTSTYYTAGTNAYVVPTGVTSITVQLWGGGGGGGAGSSGLGSGGNGGGGGYAKAVLTTTPGESLTIQIGSGGPKAPADTNGGDGGGYSSVQRGATYLAQAGAGGGGGGTRGAASGGAGGAGGGSSGAAGSTGGGTSPQGGGGGAGTTSSGGIAGTAGTGGAVGTAGAANAGGNAPAIITTCATVQSGTGGAGGTGGGGNACTLTASSCSSGGGGGGGTFGGGGGGSTSSTGRGGGGGGGGSDLVSGSGTVETAGSGITQANGADVNNNGAGAGGTGGTGTAGATAGTAGGAVISYTTTGPSTTATVSWAQFNSSTNAIQSPNPGQGACSGWCTSSVYNLPASLTNVSLVAYNGFLYALGGSNSSGTPQSSVYIAKLGANGEPQLWHPTGGTPVYWYTDTALSAARSQFAAVANNNRLYLLGGLTTSSTLLSSNTVQYANINPTGTLTTWTSTGMSALSAARYGLSAQIYNDTIYVVGGNAAFSGTPISTVEYVKLNSDGTMNAWKTANSLITSGRMTMGGSFSTIWGGYIYVGGGCTTVNVSGYCTAIASDVQLASINSDGSLAGWNTIIGLSNSRIGNTFISWQNGLYRLGGCRAQNASTGVCDDTIFDVDYGVINNDGDASTVATSVASGTAPCSGVSPTNCDLTSAVGNILNSTAIINGYLYVMGGCTNLACTTESNAVIYASIASDGTLSKPATCAGSYFDSYCSSTSTLPNALAAAGTAIFGGRIYIVGGFPSITNISYVSVGNDGSLGTWASTSTTGIGATDVAYGVVFTRANPSAAATFPGNLYILGGCTAATGVGCTTYTDAVYKCSLNTSGVPSACSTTGQLQIGTVTDGGKNNATGTGLGAMVGSVYANYVYLVGGLAPGLTDLKTSRYAKFDNSNNIVSVVTANGTGSWTESMNLTATGRRRGAGFGYNGYLYVVGGYDGTSGVLADIEFSKIDVSSGAIGAWSVSSVTISQRWGLSVPVSNSYAYVIGGCTAGAAPSSCTTRTGSIQTFQIYNNESGAPIGYSSSNNTGVDNIGGSAAIYNGYIYYAGGCTNIGCTTLTKNVYYAPLDVYGTIGTWSAGGTLPGVGGVAWGKLLNVEGTLYYLGGQTGAANTTAQATVYYTTAISSGNPTWGTATNGLVAARTQFGAAVWNDRMYVVGGFSSAGTAQATVYSSPQQITGGDVSSVWSSSSTSFNVARAGLTAVAYANNLYVLGGSDGTNYLSDTQYSQLSTSTGLAGSWTYSTSLPTSISDANGFAANGYIYIVGGRTASSVCTPVTLVAPISANTTIATGNNPTGVGNWFRTNQNYTGDRYGAAAVYGLGKAYVLGGGCTSLATSTDRVQSTTLKSQPQIAKYSRMIDTTSDVFPTKWLLNGLDNSTGAQWYLRYRSMTNTTTSCTSPAMTTWGLETNVGAVTLGTPGTYTPKDGSGVSTNCARFFYMYINIDSSQAFGYPDDVTRGPTITDLSLFFTADPSKRLIHGKTFVDGQQQPLDSPF